MVRSRDRAARAVRLADGPVLVEGSGSLDRGRVHASALVDVVGRAIGGYGALVAETAARVVRAEALDDVVLDEGVGGPAVNRQIARSQADAARIEGDVPERKSDPV